MPLFDHPILHGSCLLISLDLIQRTTRASMYTFQMYAHKRSYHKPTGCAAELKEVRAARRMAASVWPTCTRRSAEGFDG